MAEPESSDLAARLAWARGVSGLSAYALSRKAGLAKSHVSLIEARIRRKIEMGTAQSIAAVLGIDWAWLLSGEGAPPTEAQIHQAIDGAA
jgi:transcriptional regulator with XRE-family HTH domain